MNVFFNNREETGRSANCSSLTVKCLKLGIFLFPFMYGLFQGFCALAAGIYLLAVLVFAIIRGETLAVPRGWYCVIFAAFAVFSIISVFAAIDKGTAVLGLIRFMPAVIFFALVSLISYDERMELFSVIPFSCVIATGFSLIAYFIPALREYFYYSAAHDRLGGTFQYPNTYALFLVIGVIILLNNQGKSNGSKLKAHSVPESSDTENAEEEKKSRRLKRREKIIHGAEFAIMAVGLFLTGSRIALVLFFAVTLFAFIKNRHTGYYVLFILGGILIVALISLQFGGISRFGRIFTIFSNQDSMTVRLIYQKDAVKAILSNPFGLGYGGYHYAQQAFKTAVYSTRFVHNEFLQTALDFGIAPLICTVTVLVRSFFSDTVSLLQKQIMAVIVLHSLFDYNLQFLYIVFILILTLDLDRFTATVSVKKAKLSAAVCAAAMTGALGIFALCDFLRYIRRYEDVLKIYPHYTEVRSVVMENAYDSFRNGEAEIELAGAQAEKILSYNNYDLSAYEIRAEICQKNGDYSGAADALRNVVRLNKYSDQAYADYISVLAKAFRMALNTPGMEYEAEYYRLCIVEVDDIIEEVNSTVDRNAEKIGISHEVALSFNDKELIKQLTVDS
ncbi:MAG: O-antigen ligase family protein [Oscillospiraceae bacterium]|nr:O-antigen ligase family protein [Oscillospiraceae bacterium]